jgi:glycosyltransferase involved in cell wall biosynthesis
MRGADLTICISQAMKKWALQTYDVTPERILVIPCFCDCAHGVAEARHRDEIRCSLNFSRDDFVVTYSGSMLGWQLSTRALRILHLLAKAGANVCFLGLTMHASSLHRRLTETGFPKDRTRVLTVSHREVAKYLAAADLGILGRSLFEGRTVVNEVSSPIKFGEYLAVGTPVVLSEGVGDFSELTVRERVGVVLPCACDDATAISLLNSHVTAYLGDTKGFRARCQNVAQQNLDLRSWVRALASAYERVSTEAN